jgi:hypothetical protein
MDDVLYRTIFQNVWRPVHRCVLYRMHDSTANALIGDVFESGWVAIRDAAYIPVEDMLHPYVSLKFNSIRV